MAKQTRRYPSLKSSLQVETFERRNLLSGIHPLLSSWLSSPLSSALVLVPTNEGTPFTLTAPHHGHVKQDPAIAATLEALLRLQPSNTDGAVQDSTVWNLIVSLGDRHHHGDKAAAGSDSDSPPTPVVQQASDNTDPVLPVTAVTALKDSNGSQSATITSISPVDVSKDGSSKAPTSAVKSSGLQAPVQANAPALSAVDTYFGDAAAPAQESTQSISKAGTSAGDTTSASSNGAENAVSSGGGNSTSALRNQAALGAQATPVNNSLRGNATHPSVSVATAGASEARAAESYGANPSSRQDHPPLAAVGADAKSTPALFTRQASSAESVQVVEARERSGLVALNGSPERAPGQEAALLPHTEEVDDSSVSASARGAGLLGSPMPFDVDSLTQEAQQFLVQVDQLSQDLASLLARMNISPWAVAAAVTATAIAVARRRSQRAQRGLALSGYSFGGSAGLGAALDMSTVLSTDNG